MVHASLTESAAFHPRAPEHQQLVVVVIIVIKATDRAQRRERSGVAIVRRRCQHQDVGGEPADLDKRSEPLGSRRGAMRLVYDNEIPWARRYCAQHFGSLDVV